MLKKLLLLVGLFALAPLAAQGEFLDLFGGPVTPAGPPPQTKVVFITAGTTWTVPSDFTNSNTIVAIGGGAGGGGGNNGQGGGGGGGAFAIINNVSLTPGASIPVTIGAGGLGATNSANAVAGNGGDTIFNTSTLIAKGGTAGVFGAGLGPRGGAGGSGPGSTPSSGAQSGGKGSDIPSASNGGGGGGGAGGPNGPGAAGGTITGSSSGGSGGGAADGGTAGGSIATSVNGSAGGTAFDSTAGGTAGAGGASPTAGGVGSHGSGGGAGGGTTTASTNAAAGAAGGAGRNYVQTSDSSLAGPGGGGGGSGCGCGTPGGTGPIGAAGGLYGGGGSVGGNGTVPGAGGAGSPGAVVVTYMIGGGGGNAPVAPVISAPTVGQTITTTFATVSGTGAANLDTVNVTLDGSVVGTAAVAANLTWTFNTAALPNSAHTVSATETNAFGTSPISNIVTFTTNVVVQTGDTLDSNKTATSLSLSGDKLTATVIATTPDTQSMSTSSFSSGKRHFEVVVDGGGGTNSRIGVANSSHLLTTVAGSNTTSIVIVGNLNGGNTGGVVQYNNVNEIPLTANLLFVPNDLIAVEADFDNGLFWAEDVTKGTGWNGSGTANPATGVGGAAFTPGGAQWFVLVNPPVTLTRTNAVNFGASTFTATCSTGFTPWNGSATACPSGGGGGGGSSGTGLSTPVTLLPSDLPTTHWHTTARPWSASSITAPNYLTRINTQVAWYSQHTLTSPGASQGCADSSLDPYGTYTNGVGFFGSLEIPIGAQFSAGNFANATIGIQAMNCSALNYGIHNPAIQDFYVGPLNLAYQLFNTYGGGNVSAGSKSTWLNQLNHFWGIGGCTNNWGLYDMWGAWLGNQNGLTAFTGANGTTGIDNMWNGVTSSFNSCGMHQFNQMNDPPFDFYMDQNGVVPDGLSVERQSTTILAMTSEGFNGSTAAQIKSMTGIAAHSGLLMQNPTGRGVSGGRETSHNWVDTARQLSYEIMAQQLAVSDPFLAGQYQRAAALTFQDVGNYVNPGCCGSGTFFEMKNHYDPTLGIGTQFAGAGDYMYNLQQLYLLGTAYVTRAQGATVTEQPTPAEIGGYAFATNSDFGPQTVVNAGGTSVEAAMAGQTTLTTFDFPTLWTALGIERIGRVGWEARLGPPDGGFINGLGHQVTFGPTWITSGTSWTRLAQNPSTCHGAFTTTFANPALSLGKIVWTCTGSPAPVFTQNLTVTPDGVLSQTTCAGCPSTWGMTYPILRNDGTGGSGLGQTTTTTSLTQPIASTTWPGSGDSQNYMTISANPTTFFNETNEQTITGDVTPVRAFTSDATQTTFVYPMKTGETSAASVRSGMNITGTNTYTNSALSSSVVSGTDGTYYVGRTAAGGWATQVASPSLIFSGPCNFIAQINGAGHVTTLEVDRVVTATVQGAPPVQMSTNVQHSF